jgi:hypothetical protein
MIQDFLMPQELGTVGRGCGVEKGSCGKEGFKWWGGNSQPTLLGGLIFPPPRPRPEIILSLVLHPGVRINRLQYQNTNMARRFVRCGLQGCRRCHACVLCLCRRFRLLKREEVDLREKFITNIVGVDNPGSDAIRSGGEVNVQRFTVCVRG